MNIADYFISKTKPIEYQRNHYKTVSVEGDWILLQHFRAEDAYSEGASEEERHQAIIHEFHNYGIQTLSDNHTLCTVLTAIENALNSGRLYYKDPVMQELYPALKTKVHKDDFTNNITILYLLYLCYREIVWEESCLTDEQIAFIRKLCNLEEQTEHTSVCWEFIPFVLTMYHSDTIVTDIRLSYPTLYEVQRASSLYSALIHQLILHLAAGKGGLDGYRLAECQSCHQPFKKRHGNTKFCSLCGRNSERVHDYKRRRKEAANAQETHP